MPDKAFIFDLDGVLVNSVQLHYQAWARVAELHDIHFDQARMDSFRGLPREACLQSLFQDRPLSSQQIPDLLRLKDEAYQYAVRQAHPDDLLMPGVFKFLDDTRDAGIPLGIASSSVNAIFVAEHLGLSPYMDCIADGTTVENGKPAADIFIWVAGALRTRPSNCIAFEDGLVGIQAAKQAGMYVVGIGEGAWLRQADCQYTQFSDLQLLKLLAQATVHIEQAM